MPNYVKTTVEISASAGVIQQIFTTIDKCNEHHYVKDINGWSEDNLAEMILGLLHINTKVAKKTNCVWWYDAKIISPNRMSFVECSTWRRSDLLDILMLHYSAEIKGYNYYGLKY